LSEEKESTLPLNIEISCEGFPDEVSAKLAGHALVEATMELGRRMDLGILSAMTIAYGEENYKAAIQKINPNLAPSDGDAVGMAMSIDIITSTDEIRKHIVFDGVLFKPFFLEDDDFKNEEQKDDWIALAIHTIAHECAHVETTDTKQKAFPKGEFKKRPNNLHEIHCAVVISSCWDEYIVCYMSAGYGLDPLGGYLAILQMQLESIDERILENFKTSLQAQDFKEMMNSTYKLCSDLLKFSSYCIGTLKAQNLSIDTFPIFKILQESWFYSYYEMLDSLLHEIHTNMDAENYDIQMFQKIADLLDEICLKVGIVVEPNGRDVFVRMTPDAFQKTVLALS
jgi:hypothetical protein